MGHFETIEHKKVGQFKKLARDQFFKRKGTKNEILRFEAFQKIKKILSREKCILQMLYGASQGSPRIIGRTILARFR